MTPRTPGKIGVATLEDISTLILQSHDLDETLRNIVSLVAKRMRTEVCSIYLTEGDGQTLRLRASKGLSKRSIGKVTLRVGEGLIGTVIEERQRLSLQDPRSHPRYRYFKETGEERYHSFLGLPLFDRKTPIGVIAVQTREERQFTAEETSALSTIAFQISSIVVNARLLDSIRAKEEESSRFARELELTRKSLIDQDASPADPSSSVLRGTVAYPGVVSGPVHLLDEGPGYADILEDAGSDSEAERQHLEAALEKTRIQTIYLEKQVAERLSQDDAAIFHTHLMILEDRGFLDKLAREIHQGHSAPFALKKVVGEYTDAFARMDDEYLRERAADMRDIGRRLMGNLVGNGNQALQLKRPGILVGREILPSDMATIDHEKVLGIVTEVGERNAHAVIMAKALGIPAIVGVRGASKALAPDQHVILDANSGCLYIDPPANIIEEYKRLEEDCRCELHRLEEFCKLPTVTQDAESIVLRANVGLVSDIEVALRNGAEGVGLYRTEFPYMARGNFPDREDQYLLYRKVIEGFDGHPVTIRTLDIGGDKALPYFSPPREDNPFMGWRSVRVSLDNREIFRTQIEAILMAGRHGPVKLLFPMISGVEEVRACKEVVDEARQALIEEGIPFAEEIPVGVMIEVPAAVQIVDQLAQEVDFFALGTNDLIQYMLAADRNNPLVSKYYDALHPAVLQAMHKVTQTAAAQGKGLCLCGEMAADPMNLLVLVGMGIREFSMASPFIPRTKAFLRDLSTELARETAQEVLAMAESAKIRSHLVKRLQELEKIN